MSIVWAEFVNGDDSEVVDEPEKIVQRDCKYVWMVSCLDFILYEMKIYKRFNREVTWSQEYLGKLNVVSEWRCGRWIDRTEERKKLDSIGSFWNT